MTQPEERKYWIKYEVEGFVATHSSTLAWQIPWMEEPSRLQSVGQLGVGHDRATSLSLFTFTHWRRKWQPTPVFLPGESQGQGSLVGCRLCGRTELDTTEATQQQQQQQQRVLLKQEMFQMESTAKSLQSCLTLCDPTDGSHQAPPSLGFSRQEHWGGLPFPSPMRESEVAQSCPTLSDPMDCSLPGSYIHGIFQAKYNGIQEHSKFSKQMS